MKGLVSLMLLTLSMNLFATVNTYEATLKQNHRIDLEQLDLLGGSVVNKADANEVVLHCEERGSDDECNRLTYILKNENIYYVLYNSKYEKLSVDLNLLKDKSAFKTYLKKVRKNSKSHKLFNKSFLAEPLYVTGTGLMNAVWSGQFYLLLIIPLTLGIDIALLPANGAYHLVEQVQASTDSKMTRKLLSQGKAKSKIIAKNRFYRFLDSLEPL